MDRRSVNRLNSAATHFFNPWSDIISGFSITKQTRMKLGERYWRIECYLIYLRGSRGERSKNYRLDWHGMVLRHSLSYTCVLPLTWTAQNIEKSICTCITWSKCRLKEWGFLATTKLTQGYKCSFSRPIPPPIPSLQPQIPPRTQSLPLVMVVAFPSSFSC